MIFDDTYFIYQLLILNTLLLTAVITVLFRLRRLTHRSGDKNAQRDNESDKASQLLHKRISLLQKSVHDLGRKQKSLQIPAAKKLPLDDAVRMAKNGASIEELTRNCGLSKGEAQLLTRLHTAAPATVNSH